MLVASSAQEAAVGSPLEAVKHKLINMTNPGEISRRSVVQGVLAGMALASCPCCEQLAKADEWDYGAPSPVFIGQHTRCSLHEDAEYCTSREISSTACTTAQRACMCLQLRRHPFRTCLLLHERIISTQH